MTWRSSCALEHVSNLMAGCSNSRRALLPTAKNMSLVDQNTLSHSSARAKEPNFLWHGFCLLNTSSAENSSLHGIQEVIT